VRRLRLSQDLRRRCYGSSVGEVYDLLNVFNVMIYGEVQISHCLIALPGVDLRCIKYVYSHPQALAQCSRFLDALGVDVIPYHSTSSAVKMIKERGLKELCSNR